MSAREWPEPLTDDERDAMATLSVEPGFHDFASATVLEAYRLGRDHGADDVDEVVDYRHDPPTVVIGTGVPCKVRRTGPNGEDIGPCPDDLRAHWHYVADVEAGRLGAVSR